MVYTNCDIQEIKKWLRANLSEEKYRHSLGTMYSAKELATRFSLNPEKAEIAGLLHDCAKCFDTEKQMDLAKSSFTELLDNEFINKKTIHAPVGAYVASKEFGVNDPEILSAIRWHTLGKIKMSDLEKAIFIADKIEHETRKPKIRQKILAALDAGSLDGAMLACYKLTIKSLLKRNMPISTKTADIYNFYLSKINSIQTYS